MTKKEIQVKSIVFTESAFLKRLGLDGEDVLGIRAIWINGRYVAAPNPIMKIEVALNTLRETEIDPEA